jgi:hypothetical protein
LGLDPAPARASGSARWRRCTVRVRLSSPGRAGGESFLLGLDLLGLDPLGTFGVPSSRAGAWDFLLGSRRGPVNYREMTRTIAVARERKHPAHGPERSIAADHGTCPANLAKVGRGFESRRPLQGTPPLTSISKRAAWLRVWLLQLTPTRLQGNCCRWPGPRLDPRRGTCALRGLRFGSRWVTAWGDGGDRLSRLP